MHRRKTAATRRAHPPSAGLIEARSCVQRGHDQRHHHCRLERPHLQGGAAAARRRRRGAGRSPGHQPQAVPRYSPRRRQAGADPRLRRPHLRGIRRRRSWHRRQGRAARIRGRRPVRAARSRDRLLPAEAGGTARFAGGPRAAPHRHQIRQLHAALLRRAGQAGRDHQAVRFHGAGATGGPRRPDRRSRGHRQYPQGQRPRAARTHRRREFAPDRQQGFYEDEARPRHRLRPQPRRSRRRAAAGALTRRTAMTAIQRLTTTAPDFWPRLQQLLAWESVSDAAVAKTVDDILADVQQRGDAAELEYTNRFDRMQARSIGELEIPAVRLHEALARLPAAPRAALETAVARLRAYHQLQKQETWTYTEADGTVLGQLVTALDRVGLYVPGGKAAYPSSVLMNAVPAKVAGVAEVIMVVPTPGGELNELVLAAAALAGVARVFAIGGAQAVAALAYGTASVPRVDKIVGPGNIYVATAKRRVYGTVGIDMIAGPSEILIVCDGKTDPDWTAMDLFSQAEHDEDAQSILLCPDAAYLDAVQASIERLLPQMERAAIIAKSLTARGALVEVRDLIEAADVANFISPEHLELSVAEPEKLLKYIRNAGAIFMGRYTAEAVGDYCAGPNHVLPTSRTARFSSPLGVYDFQKRSSLIMCSPAGARILGATASLLARGEGLTAHARSAEYRMGACDDK